MQTREAYLESDSVSNSDFKLKEKDKKKPDPLSIEKPMTLVQTEHDYLTDNSLNSNSNSCSGETPKLGLADQIKQM